MYIPNNMEMPEKYLIADFISHFGFGLIVSPSLEASHLPLLYEPPENAQENAKGTLYGHFAKANSQWQDAENQRVLVVFSGPHSYISPYWYTDKPAAPTWNYAAVHCYGRLKLIAEPTNVLDALLRKYEPQLLSDRDLLPLEYKQKLSQGVVGFRIVIDEIQGKEKLGQQRTPADQLGVYAALSKSTEPNAMALSQYMEKRNLGRGS